MDNDIKSNPEVTINSASSFREELSKIQASDAVPNEENVVETDDEFNDIDQNQEVESEENEEKEDEAETGHMIPKGRFNKVIQQKKSLEKELEEAKAAKIKAETELGLYNQAMEKFIATKQHNNDNFEEKTFEPLDTEAHQFYITQQQKLQQELAALQHKTDQFYAMKILDDQSSAYSKIQPDFENALEYLVDKYTKANELMFDDVKDAQEAARRQLGTAARKLLDKNQNVAKAFYNKAKELGYAASKSGPNLNAINNNMAKSKVADLNSVPLSPSNKYNNLTKLDEFNKHYKPGDAESFHEILRGIRKA